jgi:transcriptional regulator with XRE-family HTH domain
MEDSLSTIKDSTTMRVGRTVKARREQLGLSARALAMRSGISSSMISDIERGAKSPTIATLSMLAGALRVPLADLVSGEATAMRIHVVRGAERRAVVDTGGARRDSFGPAMAGSRVEFLRYAVPPHTTAGPFAAHGRGTIEHVHVAAGAVRVVFGDEAVRLEAGDSCSSCADAPHLFDNTDGTVEALIYLVVERG